MRVRNRSLLLPFQGGTGAISRTDTVQFNAQPLVAKKTDKIANIPPRDGNAFVKPSAVSEVLDRAAKSAKFCLIAESAQRMVTLTRPSYPRPHNEQTPSRWTQYSPIHE